MTRVRNALRPIALLLLLVTGSSGLAFAGLQEDVRHGYSLIDQWRIEEADAWVQKVRRQYPRSGDVHLLWSRVEFYKGRYNEAWDILKKVEDDPAVREFKSLLDNTRKATAGFITAESEHFIFRYSDGPDQVLIPYAREAMEASYQVLGSILNHFPKHKVLVEIYPDRLSFSKISPLTLKDIMTSGTVALCKYNRIMLITPGALVRGYNWLDTLSHEYTHYLLSTKSHNNVPLWLHEGIAKYLETRWRGSTEHLSPIMETVLANGLQNDYLVGLEEMMPSFAKLKSAEDVQLAYAEVATMIDYLVRLKGERAIAELVDELGRETPIETALQKVVGADLATFQKNWKAYMNQRKLRTIPGLTVLKFQFKDKQADKEASSEKADLNAMESGRARDLALLGDILKARQFIEAAIIEYEKSIEEAKTLSPILYNKLAGTYIQNQQYEKAETLLLQSLNYYPMFPTTLTNLGEAYFQRKQLEKAREYFHQAELLNPFNPMVHARLIQIYAQTGKTDEREKQEKLFAYIK